MSARKPSRLPPILAALLLVVFAVAAAAQTSPHEPMTFQGFRVRSNIAVAVPTAWGPRTISMGPALFQEISPCRVLSTLEADHYPAPWGGPAFKANEGRIVQVAGLMERDGWKNPCSLTVPTTALAVALRIHIVNPAGDGTFYVAPSRWDPTLGLPVLRYAASEAPIEESAMMLMAGEIALASQGADTDAFVEILGYFIEDPDGHGTPGEPGPAGPQGPQGPAGAQGNAGMQGEPGPQGPAGLPGDTGPMGPAGPQGEQGLQGLRGEIGATGPQGAMGPQGPEGPIGLTGAQGAVGPVGPQGPEGPMGLTGARGEIGPVGPQGPEGPIGLTGAQGAVGPVGPQGPEGPMGLTGAQGAVGPAGPEGPIGLTGAQGAVGPQGPAGAQGDTGPAGPQGEAGPAGPQGPIGATGPQGLQGSDGLPGPAGPAGPTGPTGPRGPAGQGITFLSGVETFPPGGSITIMNSSIGSTSLIIVNYVNGSKGNACAVDDQGSGWAKLSGSPNKQFRYIVVD